MSASRKMFRHKFPSILDDLVLQSKCIDFLENIGLGFEHYDEILELVRSAYDDGRNSVIRRVHENATTETESE